MKAHDNREKFKDVAWTQGRVLETRTTRRWSKQDIELVSRIERRTAFAHFYSHDQGRSREFVYQFESVEECVSAIKAHNSDLEKRLCPND